MIQNFTIVGAGIAGLTTAIALNRIGIQATIFEKAPSIKEVGAGLGLGTNAMKAFRELGIVGDVIDRGKLLDTFKIYDTKGRIITSVDSIAMSKKYGVDNFTIHRAALHELLLSKLKGNTVYTNKRAVGIEQGEDKLTVIFDDGTVHETDYLVVADGIHSAIRQQLLPGSTPRYAGYTCWRAVIDHADPDLTETSETWGTAGRFGIVPLADQKTYWFACINAEQNSERMKQFTVSDLQDHFRGFHPLVDAVLKKTSNEDLIWSDIIDLRPIDQFAFDNVLLIGDAAHATTPNMGQGACQAVEDAVVLMNELKKNIENPAEAFRLFEKKRMRRTHWVVNTSWKIGKLAQVENKVLAGLRNSVFRLIPPGVREKQFRIIAQTDF